MNTRCLGHLVMACIFLAAATAHAGDGLTRISQHVYAYVARDASPANSFGANAGIVIGDEAIAVVDSLVSARQGRRLLTDIRKISDKPIRYLINTHGHLDHTLGNGVFAAEGATIVAQRECDRDMRANLAATLAQADAYGLTAEDMAGTAPAYPTLIFDRNLRLNLGGIDVDLLYFGPSHSPGSIMVHIPADEAAFAGDILFTDFYPYMGTGDVAGWLKSLTALSDLGARYVIPGHGPLSNVTDIQAMVAYLRLFDRKARQLVETGATPEAATAELKQVLPPRAQGEWLIRASLEGKYLRKP
jgi:cyclase